MYNLSPRWRKSTATTPDTLGPNNYDLPEKLILPNRVPFLSSKLRKSGIGQPVYCDTFYNNDRRHRIIGGSSLKNRSQRKIKVDSVTPSPGAYNPKLLEKKSFRAANAPIVKGKKLYVCNVPYSLSASGPSIPTKIDANGYDYNEKGQLIKILAEVHDESMRPAFYNVTNDPCLTTKMYKGCRWSKSRTQRSELAKGDGPGPAAYDARFRKKAYDDAEYVREMARRFSFQPRYLDMLQSQITRNDYPGPGSYNLSKGLRRPKSLSLNPAGFGSGAKRPGLDLGFELSDPTKYDVGKSFLLRSVSIKDVPFNVDSLRFPKKNELVTPGPAEYDTIGEIEANLQRVMCSVTDRTPPFNHSAERDTLHISPETLMTPAPNRYLVQRISGEKKPCEGSVFRSVTGRFVDQRVSKSAEPATYSVSEPFNRSRNRNSYNIGRVPFQTAAPRQSLTRPSSFYNPDPCKYSSQSEVNSKGYFFPMTERFDILQETPGPANYSIHPSLGTSTYKAVGTFNLRLKEQVVRSKLRLPPEVTRQEWLNEIKKRKQLVAFYRPPKKISSWLELD